MAKTINHKTIAISQKGVTLVELAIMLVILGILVGLGAGLIGPLTKRAKYNESEDIVESAVESVVSYGASRNKLPVTGDFTSTISNPNDAWQKPLYYIVDSNLTDTSLGGICGRKTTNITVTICPDLTCSSPTTTISNVAFIALSGAANYNNQTAGTQAISSATTLKVFESDYVVDNYTGDMDRSEEYDDIVDWVGIDELRTKVNCTGAALKIINNELPFTYEGSTYSAAIFTDGGVPFSSGGDYRWCRHENASSGFTFTPSTLTTNCLVLPEASWGQGDELTISGAAALSGTYRYTFYVRDNNDPVSTDDNIATRSLAITVNPETSPGVGCTAYRVWNDIGKDDYLIDGTCKEVTGSAEITTPELLNNGETIVEYASTDGTCTGMVTSLTYAGAVTADANEDCCVNFDGSDATCP